MVLRNGCKFPSEKKFCFKKELIKHYVVYYDRKFGEFSKFTFFNINFFNINNVILDLFCSAAK